jgi:hypothetical protein
MSAVFSAYVNKANLTTVESVIRAMSSRGWRVDIESSDPMHLWSGPLEIKIDGEPIAIEVSVSETDKGELAERRKALEVADDPNATLLRVLKKTDFRINFAGGDQKGEFWSRVLARNVAILSVGAFESSVTGKLLYYAS